MKKVKSILKVAGDGYEDLLTYISTSYSQVSIFNKDSVENDEGLKFYYNVFEKLNSLREYYSVFDAIKNINTSALDDSQKSYIYRYSNDKYFFPQNIRKKIENTLEIEIALLLKNSNLKSGQKQKENIPLNIYKEALVSNLTNPAVIEELTSNNKIDPKESKLLDLLINNFNLIISGNPEDFENIINEIENQELTSLLITEDNKSSAFGKKILQIFDYDGFKQKEFVFDFYSRLSINTCLYCNANYTLSVKQITTNKKNSPPQIKKKKLFQLDHFFPKSRFPYLSISFANLVPCCSNCNLWKKETDTKLDTFYHPFYHDFSADFSFKLKDEWTLKTYISDFSQKDEFLDFENLKDKNIDKVKNHIEVFSIKEIYNQHKEPLLDLLMRQKQYDTCKIEDLKNDFKELDITESDINNFILGTYFEEEDINKKPLTKFIQDISKGILF